MTIHWPRPPHAAALLMMLLLVPCIGAGADEALDKARAAWIEGQPKAALIRLKSILQQNPEDARARLLLARIYLDAGDAGAAEQEVQRARRAGLADADAFPVLAEALLAQGRAGDVLDDIQVPDDAPAPARAQLLALRGEAQLQTQDMDAAKESFDEALALDADNVRAGVGMAQLQAVKGDIADARAALTALGEAHPDAVEVWEARGTLEFTAQDYAAAAAAFTQALEQGRRAWTNHYRRALARIEAGDIKGAQRDIDAVAADAPKFVGLSYLRGRVHLLASEPAAAAEELESYLRSAPDDPRAIYYCGLALYQTQRYAQAEEYLQRLSNRFSGSAMTATLLGLTRLASGDAAGAEAAVKPFASSEEATPATLEVLRRALAAQGRRDEAAAIVPRMVDRFPDLVAARLMLAQQLGAAGDNDAAINQIRTALQQKPDDKQARVLLIRTLIIAGDDAAAMTEANALVDAQPESALAHTVLAAVYTHRQQLDTARAEFRKALELDPGYTRAALALAALDLGTNDADAARETIDSLLAADPDNTSALLARAGLERRTSGDAAFIEQLRDDLSRNPDNLTLRQTLARAYLRKGEAQAALTLLQGAPADQREQSSLLLLQAQAELAAGRGESAIVTLGQLADLNPRAARPRYMLAAASARVGDLRAAELHLEEGLSLDHDEALAPAQLSVILSAAPSDKERMKLIERLQRAAPDQPLLAATHAQLAARQRDFGTAIDIYEGLRRRYPDREDYVVGLAQTLNEAGRQSEAETLLDDWVGAHPRSVNARMLLAQMALRSDKPAAAIEQYRKVIEVQPDHPVAMNNLAMLIAEQKPEEALELAERGLKQRPNDPSFMDTVGLVLLQLGQGQRARDMLGKAHLATPDPSIAFRYAKALVATGDPDQARRILLQNADKSYPEQAEAEELLRSLRR